jgi:hypothetical protein
MALIGWPRCCQTAYEQAFYGWLAENAATMNATMSGTLTAQMSMCLPFIAEQFECFRIVIRVVDIPIKFDAHVITKACSNAHIVRAALLSSGLLFLIWRLFMVVSSSCISADAIAEGMRYRLRPPAEQDVAQLKHSFDAYLRGLPVDKSALEQLQTALFATPTRGQTLFGRAAMLAELYVILHEVGHILPFPGIDRFTLGDIPMHPERKAAWLAELKADTSACEMMLVGILSALTAESNPPIDPQQNQSAMRAMRGHAFDLIASAVHVVHAAMWFAARASAPDGVVNRMPARVDPQYRTHPPVQVRDCAFGTWLEARMAETDTPDACRFSPVIEEWLHHLADLVFKPES